MNEFTGGTVKVRCIDCTHLSEKKCVRKKTSVVPKKHRTCALYHFKGEYINRTPAEAMYVPYIDNSTRKLLRKMSKLGIIPVAESPDAGGSYKRIPMPSSTATAGVLGVKNIEDQMLEGSLEGSQGSSAPPEENVPASTASTSEENNEQDSSGG